MNLFGKLPAELCCHHALDVLDNARQQTPVVVKLLGAIGDPNAILFADKLIVRAFVDVLEATPPTDVVYKDVIKISASRLDIVNKLDQAQPAFDLQATAA